MLADCAPRFGPLWEQQLHIAVDGLFRSRCMHRGNDQVSRLRGIESELHCSPSPQFAYNDNIGSSRSTSMSPCLKEGYGDPISRCSIEGFFSIENGTRLGLHRDNMWSDEDLLMSLIMAAIVVVLPSLCPPQNKEPDRTWSWEISGERVRVEIELLNCLSIRTRKNPIRLYVIPVKRTRKMLTPDTGIAWGNGNINRFYLP